MSLVEYLSFKQSYLKMSRSDLELQGGVKSEEDLTKLFDIMKNAAKKLQLKKYPDANGLKFWEPIKKELQKYDEIVYNFDVKLNKNYIKKVKNMKEEEDGQTIEINHFIKQPYNITTKDKKKTSLRKIIQIALNIGQFEGMRKKMTNIDNEIKKIHRIFKKNKMDQLNVYTTSNSIDPKIFKSVNKAIKKSLRENLQE